jgi:competence protein ComEC
LIAFLLGRNNIRKISPFKIFLFFLIGFSIGIARYAVSDYFDNQGALDQWKNESVTIRGVVVDEPQQRKNGWGLVVDTQSIDNGGEIVPVHAKVIAGVPAFSDVSYGDEVFVNGTLAVPQNFQGSDGRIFDYISYLSLENIHYQLNFANANVISHGKGNPLQSFLFSVKRTLMQSIKSVLPEPHSLLVAGLLFGDKRAMGKNLEDDFRKAGVIHVVILSGYSMTLIAHSLIRLFSFLPKSGAIFSSAFFIILFTIMTGGSAMATRASIMAILVLLSKYSRRKYNIIRALSLTIFLMVFYNPKILVFDVAFQLSIISVLGLIFLSPFFDEFFDKKFSWVGGSIGGSGWKKSKLKEFIVSTVCIQIITFPFLLYKMGEISIVALPVNILIMFFIPATMLSSFLTAITATLSHFSGYFFATPFIPVTYFLLQYQLSIVEFFAHLPFATLKITVFPWWAVVLIYTFYFLIYWKKIRPGAWERSSRQELRS